MFVPGVCAPVRLPVLSDPADKSRACLWSGIFLFWGAGAVSFISDGTKGRFSHQSRGFFASKGPKGQIPQINTESRRFPWTISAPVLIPPAAVTLQITTRAVRSALRRNCANRKSPPASSTSLLPVNPFRTVPWKPSPGGFSILNKRKRDHFPTAPLFAARKNSILPFFIQSHVRSRSSSFLARVISSLTTSRTCLPW